MTARTCQDLLDVFESPQPPGKISLAHELLRSAGTETPRWLEFCATVAELFTEDAGRALCIAQRALKDSSLNNKAFRVNHERNLLHTKTLRCLELAVRTQNGLDRDISEPKSLEEDLLQKALINPNYCRFRAGFGDSRSGAPALDGCDTIVLVVHTDPETNTNQPAAMQLHLWRVPTGKRVSAKNALVRAPGSYLWITDREFDKSLQSVEALLKIYTCGNTGFAIAWDLRPAPLGAHAKAPTILGIDGPSASGALAVGALALLREFVVDPAIRRYLYEMSPSHLAISAQIKLENARPMLDKVGAIDVKAGVFEDIDPNNLTLPKCFIVHTDQRYSGNKLDGTPFEPHKARDVQHLLQIAARENEEKVSSRAATLFEKLCQGTSLEEIHEADKEIFHDVAESTPESIKGYLLKRYAKWARGDHDVLERDPRGLSTDFVNIQLMRESSDPESQPEPIKHLQELIGSDPRAKAWLLIAGPGAGKTSLLAHWELGRVLHALHRRYGVPRSLCDGFPISPEFRSDWCERARNDEAASDKDIELCIFVPLRQLTATSNANGEDALAEFWADTYPKLQSLTELLKVPHLRIRFLLDAVNEVQAELTDKHLEQVAQWLAKQHRTLRPVITVRELQRNKKISSDNLRPKVATLLEWNQADIERYIDHRLPTAKYPAANQSLKGAVRHDEQLQALFKTPGNLAVQCSLLRLYPDFVLRDRAALFATLIKLRIRGAVADIPSRELLTDDDRTELSSFEDSLSESRASAIGPDLPEDGCLVPALSRFAQFTRSEAGLSVAKSTLVNRPDTIGLTNAGVVRDWIDASRKCSFLYAPLKADDQQARDLGKVTWQWELFSEFFWARGRERSAEFAAQLEAALPRLNPPTEAELIHALESRKLDRIPRVDAHPQTEAIKFLLELRKDAKDIEEWIRWLETIDLTLAARAAIAVRSRLEPHEHQCWVDIDETGKALNPALEERVGGVANGTLRWLREKLLRRFTQPVRAPEKPDSAASYEDIRHRRDWGLLLGDLGGCPLYELKIGMLNGRETPYLCPKRPQIKRIGPQNGKIKCRVGGEASPARFASSGLDIEMRAFEMWAHLVTNAEYRFFVDAGGYASEFDEIFWAPVGSEPAVWLSQLRDSSLQSGRQLAPRGWASPTADGALQPVVGITWWEARAYARFVDALERSQEEGGDRGISQFALPTEAEWCAAAAGFVTLNGESRPVANYRDWPFAVGRGRAPPDPLQINFESTCLGMPSPVGLFHRGHTPESVEDLAGNVLEWIGSEYKPTFDERCVSTEATDDSGQVVVRGGHFRSNLVECGTKHRQPNAPLVDGNIGFRLVRRRR